MKMRIQGNVLRFRLNRSEVAELAGGGSVQAALAFPGGRTLSYGVAPASATAIVAGFAGDAIRVELPEATVRDWAAGEQVAIRANVGGLEVLVEKDFQCLHKGEAGKDPDCYPNPAAKP
jgi:hypothetical protein